MKIYPIIPNRLLPIQPPQKALIFFALWVALYNPPFWAKILTLIPILLAYGYYFYRERREREIDIVKDLQDIQTRLSTLENQQQ